MSFPFIRQTDSKLCGLTCLSSIFRYYGKRVSLKILSGYCDIHPEGISILSLSKTARLFGMETLCVSIPYSKIKYIDTPCILHWNQNHYVVLYRINKKKEIFYICDPAKGKYKLHKKDLIDHWLGVSEKGAALLLEPNPDFKDIKDFDEERHLSLSIITGYLHEYRGYLAQLAIGLLFTSCLQFVFPFLTQSVVDIGIHNRNINLLWMIMVGWLIIVFAKTLTEVIRRWLMLHITMRVNVSLISEFFMKLMELPMQFFESRTIGDLSQRVRDHNRVQSFLTSQLLSSIFSVLTFIVFGIILCIYDIRIFLIFFTGSSMYALWVLFFMKKRKIIDYETFEVEAVNQSKTYQFLSSVQEIKIQNCKKRRRWEWEDIQSDLFLIKQKALRLQQIQESGAVFLTEVKNIVIIVMSAMLVMDHQLSIGEMMSIMFIVGQLNAPLDQIMGLVYSFQDMKISLQRINEVYHNEDEAAQGGSRQNIESSNIIFNHVSFKYDRHSPKYAVDDISCAFEENKVTAIVGHSGSGKTTLVKLILGYYANIEGEILVSGKNLNVYDVDWLRSCFGVVMQDGFIFSESIARNIAIDDNDIDWDKLYHAAEIANIRDYIEGLPLGYNTIIGKEGAGLSQGQKQRILIARAVYRDPMFLILDEATNALDATNELSIVENLEKYCKGKTVLVVAHRLSTVRNADKIIVMDHGRIVESGNHSELISQRGYYFKLIKNQLELSK